MDLKQLYQYVTQGNEEQKLKALKALVRMGTPDAGKVLVKAFKSESDTAFKSKLHKGIQVLKERLEKGAESKADAPKPQSKPEPPKTKQKESPSSSIPVEVPEEISDETIASIKEELRSGNPELEAHAFAFIKQAKLESIIPDLIQIHRENQDEAFTKKVIDTVVILKPENLLQVICSFFTGAGVSIIYYALDCLKDLNALEECLDALKRLLNHREREVRLHSREILEQMEADGNEEAAAILEEIPLNPADKVAKVEFVNPDIDPDLLPKTKEQLEAEKKEQHEVKSKAYVERRVVEESRDQDEILKAVDKLVSVKDAALVEIISQRLATEKDADFQALFLGCLAKTKNPTALATVRTYMENDNIQIKRAAVKAVSALMDEDSPKNIFEKLINDEDPEIRATAIIGFFPVNPMQCYLPLSALCNPEKGDEYNRCGLLVLEKLRSESHLLMLHKLWKNGSEDIKKKAGEILESWSGDSEPVQYLLANPDTNFQQYMSRWTEEKKRKEAAAREMGLIEDEPEVQSKPEEDDGLGGLFDEDEEEEAEEEIPEKKPFWKGILNKIKKGK
jgi:HEAT repeat protein